MGGRFCFEKAASKFGGGLLKTKPDVPTPYFLHPTSWRAHDPVRSFGKGRFPTSYPPPQAAVQYGAVAASPLPLLFALELALALIGALWMRLAGYVFFPAPRPWHDTLYFLAGYAALLLLERLTERLAPAAYRELDRLMHGVGRMLKSAGVGHNTAMLLALASAVGEELFFRGALQNALTLAAGPSAGLVLQSAVFALGHPAPGRAGRLYAVWAFAAGLIFGALYLLSGSLVPGILAHFLYNAKGFAEIFEEPGPASR